MYIPWEHEKNKDKCVQEPRAKGNNNFRYFVTCLDGANSETRHGGSSFMTQTGQNLRICTYLKWWRHFMFTASKQLFQTYLYVLNRSRGFAKPYFQRLTHKLTNPKWPPPKHEKSYFCHIFGYKRGININKTSFCMFSGTRNPLKPFLSPHNVKKRGWPPYLGKFDNRLCPMQTETYFIE